MALDAIADVEASGLWPGPVVTEVAPVGDFWEAEPEHQDYLERYPTGYTCHFPRQNWVLPRRGSDACLSRSTDACYADAASRSRKTCRKGAEDG